MFGCYSLPFVLGREPARLTSWASSDKKCGWKLEESLCILCSNAWCDMDHAGALPNIAHKPEHMERLVRNYSMKTVGCSLLALWSSVESAHVGNDGLRRFHIWTCPSAAMQDLCIERFSFAQDRKIMRLAIMELQRFKVFFELRCSIMFDLSSPVYPCFPGSSCKGFFPQNCCQISTSYFIYTTSTTSFTSPTSSTSTS